MTLPLVTSVLAIVADQVTKHLARSTLAPHRSVPILGDVFRLTYVENSGIAFGINFPGGPVIFTVTSMVATLVVMGYAWKFRNRELLLRLSLALIVGGAVGNVIDRLLFGKVVDFLDFSIGAFHWPVFNVADSCVTVGIVLFLYHSLFRPAKSS